MKTLFARDDYRPLKEGETYKNKFVIIEPGFFKEEFQEAKYQLLYAQSGFGCDPSKLGGKIFGRSFDGDEVTRDCYVLGVATEDAIAQWEKMYGMSREVFFKKD